MTQILKKIYNFIKEKKIFTILFTFLSLFVLFFKKGFKKKFFLVIELGFIFLFFFFNLLIFSFFWDLFHLRHELQEVSFLSVCFLFIFFYSLIFYWYYLRVKFKALFLKLKFLLKKY
jgi:hypothetical protein